MSHYGFWNFAGNHPLMIGLTIFMVLVLIQDMTANICNTIARKSDDSGSEDEE